jgi:hypothetical protein
MNRPILTLCTRIWSNISSWLYSPIIHPPSFAPIWIDIMNHLVALIPIDDYETVSALSCVCKGWSGLVTRWLRMNDFIDARTLPTYAEITPFDRLHGELVTEWTSRQRYILERGLRAFVFHCCTLCSPSVDPCTYRFRCGRLVSWHTLDSMHEVISIADAPVVVKLRWTATTGLIQLWLLENMMTFMQISCIRLTDDGQMTVGPWDIIWHSVHPDDWAALKRVCDMDLEPLIASYRARLRRQLRS